MKICQDYKTFNIDSFSKDIKGLLQSHVNYDHSCFRKVFFKLLNKHASINKKMLHFNNNPFMSKALRNGIINRSKSRNIKMQN